MFPLRQFTPHVTTCSAEVFKICVNTKTDFQKQTDPKTNIALEIKCDISSCISGVTD